MIHENIYLLLGLFLSVSKGRDARLWQGIASMTAKATDERDDARQIFAGRIDVLYSLGRHYLSLPFAALCVPATILAGHGLGFLPIAPLILQLLVVIAAEHLNTLYRQRPVESDPYFW